MDGVVQSVRARFCGLDEDVRQVGSVSIWKQVAFRGMGRRESPDQKGIETIIGRQEPNVRWQRRRESPDQKGIETTISSTSDAETVRRRESPDQKGIETLCRTTPTIPR